MNPGVAPDWVAQWLPIILGLTVIAGAVWLVFVLLDYLNRKDYNLTPADRGGAGGSKPDFLSVDHAKRAQAQAAGEAFDQKIAARDRAEAEAAAPAPARSKFGGVARMVTLIFSILTIVVVGVGAFGRIERYDEAVRQLTNMERLTEIVSTYWMGFLVVIGLVVAQIFQAVRRSGVDDD